MRLAAAKRPLATVWLLALIVALGVNLRAMFGAVPPFPSAPGAGNSSAGHSWLVAAATSVMLLLGFSTIAWLAPSFEDLGMSSSRAALMFVVFQCVQILSMLTLPSLTDVLPGKRLVFAVALASTSTGFLLFVVAPLTLAVPASLLAGFGVGGGTSLALVLIQYVATTREQASRISAVSMFVGYTTAAAGPLALGALRDATGGFTSGYVMLLCLSLTSLVLLVPLGSLRSEPPGALVVEHKTC